MRKPISIGLAVGLMSLLFAAVPALASAAPTWLVNGAAPAGAVPVLTHSPELELSDAALGVTLVCEADDTGTVGPGAEDSITSFVNTNCNSNVCPAPAVNTVALGLPWPTELFYEEVEPEKTIIRDHIGNAEHPIEILVRCGEENLALYTGTLNPVIEPGVAIFDASAGSLTNATFGTPGVITGSDFVEGENGEAISAE